MAGARWLLHGAARADSLVFAFSGHGALDVAPHLAHSGSGRDGILPCDHEQVPEGPACCRVASSQFTAPSSVVARQAMYDRLMWGSLSHAASFPVWQRPVQAGPVHDEELHAALVAPLPTGARLHCLVDACRGAFVLGLPACVYTRADGWSNWEVRAMAASLGVHPQQLGSVPPAA